MSNLNQDKESNEVIIYRGLKIDVGRIRDWLSRCHRSDGTPYYTPEKLEERVQKEILDHKRRIGRMMGNDKYGGYRLAFYQKEKQIFSTAYSIHVSDELGKQIVKKLLRHFGNSRKAKAWGVRFYGHRDSGSCGWGIRLSHDPSIGLICHEVSHTFESKHCKKLLTWMRRMINYCEKHNYWIQIEPKGAE